MKNRSITFITLLVILVSSGCNNHPSRSRSVEGSFFNIDSTSRGTDLPLFTDMHSYSGTAWRGERISSQLLIWVPETNEELNISTSALIGKNNILIPEEHIKLYEIKYVMTDLFADGCEKTGIANYDSSMVADLLEPLKNPFELESGVPKLIWISVDIPADAVPGRYSSTIAVASGRRKGIDFKLEVEVKSSELPSPADWSFHLDLWQNPFSVARYFNVEPWSEEHFEKMRPTMEMLANTGQKCITTTITGKPWGGNRTNQG